LLNLLFFCCKASGYSWACCDVAEFQLFAVTLLLQVLFELQPPECWFISKSFFKGMQAL